MQKLVLHATSKQSATANATELETDPHGFLDEVDKNHTALARRASTALYRLSEGAEGDEMNDPQRRHAPRIVGVP